MRGGEKGRGWLISLSYQFYKMAGKKYDYRL